ncbi:preprotein translocase subunit SecG, partial [Treponema pallidum]
MAVLSVMILSLLVVVCLLVVTLVLLQTEEGDGLGGMFSGGSRSAFGSRSASVLTKTSYVMVGLFFGLTFFLALLNRAPDDTGLQKAA